jgi:hypothetical protein
MDEPLHHHIQAIGSGRYEARLLADAITSERTEPAALQWVRRWHPDAIGAELPSCGCAAGRCTLCN